MTDELLWLEGRLAQTERAIDTFQKLSARNMLSDRGMLKQAVWAETIYRSLLGLPPKSYNASEIG